MKVPVIVYGVSLTASDEVVNQTGLDAADQEARARNMVVASDIVKIMDMPSVYVEGGGYYQWLPIYDVVVNGQSWPGVGPTYGKPTARTVMWEAEFAVSPESMPVEGTREDDGAVMIVVPDVIEQYGGIVRAMHRLDTLQVRVDAYKADGEPVGYLVANGIDRDEAEVPVSAGTGLLRVVAS